MLCLWNLSFGRRNIMRRMFRCKNGQKQQRERPRFAVRVLGDSNCSILWPVSDPFELKRNVHHKDQHNFCDILKLDFVDLLTLVALPCFGASNIPMLRAVFVKPFFAKHQNSCEECFIKRFENNDCEKGSALLRRFCVIKLKLQYFGRCASAKPHSCLLNKKQKHFCRALRFSAGRIFDWLGKKLLFKDLRFIAIFSSTALILSWYSSLSWFVWPRHSMGSNRLPWSPGFDQLLSPINNTQLTC